MTTKIHATVDALGNPTGFHLTPGQAHDLEGADVLLKDTQGATVIADKAYDAQARVIEPLQKAGKAVVIPSICTKSPLTPCAPGACCPPLRQPCQAGDGGRGKELHRL